MTKKGQKGKKLPHLTQLELQVIGIVWQFDECTSTQVVTEFARIRPLAPTTIRTVLSKLLQKGYLKRVPTVERGYKFRATVPRECVAHRSLKELLSSLFDDSPRQAIAYLLSETNISHDDLEEIRQMIESRKQNPSGEEK